MSKATGTRGMERVRVYHSQTRAYHEAFQVFLSNTDQQIQAQRWLKGLIEKLPSRKLFVDAGAGNGKFTAWFKESFERTISVEPNEWMRSELRHSCSGVEIIPDTILDVHLDLAADFVLCSHVLCDIDQHDWVPTLKKLASWLGPEGVLIVVLQHHTSDCMRMLQHFFGRHFNLSDLAAAFECFQGDRYEVSLAKVPSHVTTSDFKTAEIIAELMLNLLPIKRPPLLEEFEEYVRSHFGHRSGGFRFSCDQDFLQIRFRKD